jgi:hypothetical protein
MIVFMVAAESAVENGDGAMTHAPRILDNCFFAIVYVGRIRAERAGDLQ